MSTLTELARDTRRSCITQQPDLLRLMADRIDELEDGLVKMGIDPKLYPSADIIRQREDLLLGWGDD